MSQSELTTLITIHYSDLSFKNLRFIFVFRHNSASLDKNADVIVSEPLMLMPDLAVFFKAFTLSLHDDLAKNNQGAIIQVKLIYDVQ